MPKPFCAFPECKTKIKLVEVTLGTCRCEKVFCLKHRLPETHTCPIIFKLDKDDFIKENICVAPKIDAL